MIYVSMGIFIEFIYRHTYKFNQHFWRNNELENERTKVFNSSISHLDNNVRVLI